MFSAILELKNGCKSSIRKGDLLVHIEHFIRALQYLKAVSLRGAATEINHPGNEVLEGAKVQLLRNLEPSRNRRHRRASTIDIGFVLHGIDAGTLRYPPGSRRGRCHAR